MTARALLETANEIDGLLVEFQRDISGEAQRQIYLRVADLRNIASSLAEQPATQGGRVEVGLLRQARTVLARFKDDDAATVVNRIDASLSAVEQPAHSRAQAGGVEAVFRCTICGSHCDSDGRSLYRPPAEQPAKGEGLAWPATREEMDAYWAAYSENRANGEGAAIRAGLEAYRACLVGNPMQTPQPSDPADAVLTDKEKIAVSAGPLTVAAMLAADMDITPPTAQRHEDGENDMLLQAIARGWCSPENSGKVMDPELATAIAREVSALPAHGAGAAVEAVAEIKMAGPIPQKVLDWRNGMLPFVRDNPVGTKLYTTLPQQRSDEAKPASPNDCRDVSAVIRHGLFFYEVDFGDEGKGCYVRLYDFNRVVEKLEKAAHGAGAAVEAVAAYDRMAAMTFSETGGLPALRAAAEFLFAWGGEVRGALVRTAALSTQPLPQPAGVSDGSDALARAVRAYQSEFDNPCPDYNLRAQRRKEMFAAAALHPEQAKDGAAG